MEPLKNCSFDPSNLTNPAGVGQTARISTFAGWCRAAGVDEWTALQKVVGGDHAAMTFLRFALRWGEASAVQAAGGWFYQTYEQWHADTGLTRSQVDRVRKVLKASVGMTDKRQRRRLPDGTMLVESCLHYRIDPVALWVAFVWHCLPERARLGLKSQAELVNVCNLHLRRYDVSQSSVFYTWQLQQIANCQTQEASNSQTPKTGEVKTLDKTHQNHSNQTPQIDVPDGTERDTADSDAHPGKDDLPTYLHGLYDALGTPNGSTGQVLNAAAAIGEERAAAVVKRCEGEARSWKYVITALEREATVKPSTSGRKLPGGAAREPASATGRFAEFFDR